MYSFTSPQIGAQQYGGVLLIGGLRNPDGGVSWTPTNNICPPSFSLSQEVKEEEKKRFLYFQLRSSSCCPGRSAQFSISVIFQWPSGHCSGVVASKKGKNLSVVKTGSWVYFKYNPRTWDFREETNTHWWWDLARCTAGAFHKYRLLPPNSTYLPCLLR